MENYCVYILANKQNTVLFTGVTNNFLRRIIEHKTKTVKGFTEKYNLNKLVWFEQTKDIKLEIHREKQIKKWRRNWKNELVEEKNPLWKDLFYEIGGTNEMLNPGFLNTDYEDH